MASLGNTTLLKPVEAKTTAKQKRPAKRESLVVFDDLQQISKGKWRE
ncbi:hypothetical protein [Azospirillum agricola]|nr:hypothetical protein [Azospirillum agricola]